MLNPFLLRSRIYARIIQIMKINISKKTSSIIWAVVYLGLIVTICCTGCSIFERYYYTSVFVSGQSMNPTLKGGEGEGVAGKANFGIVDGHDLAKENIKRFNVITCYYPWSSSDYTHYEPGQTKPNGYAPERKIKRVLGLPGETIETIDGNIYIHETAKVPNEIDESVAYRFGFYGDDYYDESNSSISKHQYTYFSANVVYYNHSYNKSSEIYLENEGDNNFVISYYAENDQHEKEIRYLSAISTYDGVSLSFPNKKEEACVWKYNEDYQTFTVFLGEHVDSSLDGTYFISANITPSLTDYDTFVLRRFEDIDKYKVSHLFYRDSSKTIVYSDNPLLIDTYPSYKMPFKRSFDLSSKTVKDIQDCVLDDGCYWVQGDHWSNSSDCVHTISGIGNVPFPIYYDNIDGVLVAIQGTCTIGYKKNADGKKEKVCRNHIYGIPKIVG